MPLQGPITKLHAEIHQQWEDKLCCCVAKKSSSWMSILTILKLWSFHQGFKLINPSIFISTNYNIHQLLIFQSFPLPHELKSEVRILMRLPLHGKHLRHLQYFLLKEILGLTNLLLTCPAKRGKKKRKTDSNPNTNVDFLKKLYTLFKNTCLKIMMCSLQLNQWRKFSLKLNAHTFPHSKCCFTRN